MWKNFLVAAGAYLSWIFWSVFLPMLGNGPFAHVPLSYVLVAGVFAGPWAGGACGFLLGLAMESNTAVPFMVYTLPLAAAGLLAGLFRRAVWWRRGVAAVVLCVLALGVMHLNFALAAFRSNAAFSISFAIFHIILPELGLTLLVTLLGLSAASVWRANRR